VQAFSSTQVETHKTVSEILDWIQTHLETTTTNKGSGGTDILVGVNPYTYTSDFALSFDGCQLTVTWHFLHKDTTLNLDDAGTISGPLDLGGLRSEPEQMPISHDSGSYNLKLFSAKPSLIVSFYPGQRPGRDPNGRNFVLAFATQDVAERQRNAWHDAIILCGGKKTQNDLY
jgi:hypothetical protein